MKKYNRYLQYMTSGNAVGRSDTGLPAGKKGNSFYLWGCHITDCNTIADSVRTSIFFRRALIMSLVFMFKSSKNILLQGGQQAGQNKIIGMIYYHQVTMIKLCFAMFRFDRFDKPNRIAVLSGIDSHFFRNKYLLLVQRPKTLPAISSRADFLRFVYSGVVHMMIDFLPAAVTVSYFPPSRQTFNHNLQYIDHTGNTIATDGRTQRFFFFGKPY